MEHLSEDQILAFCLDTLSEAEGEACHAHLERCETCATRVTQVQQEVAGIADFGLGLPPLAVPVLPRARTSMRTRLPRRVAGMVATLLLGVVLGFGAAGSHSGVTREVLPAPRSGDTWIPERSQTCPGVDLVVGSLATMRADTLRSGV